jgi:hypothetical protein
LVDKAKNQFPFIFGKQESRREFLNLLKQSLICFQV